VTEAENPDDFFTLEVADKGKQNIQTKISTRESISNNLTDVQKQLIRKKTMVGNRNTKP